MPQDLQLERIPVRDYVDRVVVSQMRKELTRNGHILDRDAFARLPLLARRIPELADSYNALSSTFLDVNQRRASVRNLLAAYFVMHKRGEGWAFGFDERGQLLLTMPGHSPIDPFEQIALWEKGQDVSIEASNG